MKVVKWCSTRLMKAPSPNQCLTQKMVNTIIHTAAYQLVSELHPFSSISISAFIADTGKECFVWIGKGASQCEKRQAMSYAHVSKTCRNDHNYTNEFIYLY